MGSSSSSKQSNRTIDRRIGAAEGAVVVAEGSNAGFSTVNNITQTDQGAVAASAATVNNAVDKAFGFGEAALDFSGDTVRISLDTVEETVGDSLSFANDTVDDSIAAILNVNRDAAENIQVSNKSVRDIASLAVDRVERANRNENTESFRALLTTTGLIAAGGIVAWAMRG